MDSITFNDKIIPPFYIHVDSGVVTFEKYGNGETAIDIVDLDEGLFATATVNLEAYGLAPEPGNVFIKDYSENRGIWEFLVEIGVIGNPIREVPFGPYDAKAQECPLLVK